MTFCDHLRMFHVEIDHRLVGDVMSFKGKTAHSFTNRDFLLLIALTANRSYSLVL